MKMGEEITLKDIKKAIKLLDMEAKLTRVCADCYVRGYVPNRKHKDCSGNWFEIDQFGRIHNIGLGKDQQMAMMDLFKQDTSNLGGHIGKIWGINVYKSKE